MYRLIAVLAALLSLLMMPACKKCKSIKSASAPEVALIDQNPNSPRYNENIGYVDFDINQSENDGGECGTWAAVLTFVVHNNTNQTMYLPYTVSFTGNKNWSKNDSISIPAFGAINKLNFSYEPCDYAHGTLAVTTTKVTYQ